jgi:Ni,Fe-hydrogenase maturation factor
MGASGTVTIGVRLSSGGLGGVVVSVGNAVAVGDGVGIVMAQLITNITKKPRSIIRADLMVITFLTRPSLAVFEIDVYKGSSCMAVDIRTVVLYNGKVKIPSLS